MNQNLGNEQKKAVKKSSVLYLVTAVLFVAGAVLGFVFPDFFTSISVIGTIYVNLLKLIVIPLLMCEIMYGVSASAGKAMGITVRSVLLFAVMFCVSFLITAGVASLVLPRLDLAFMSAGESWQGQAAAASLPQFLQNIFTSNIFSSMAKGDILPCIIFAFVCGIALSRIKAERTREVLGELRGLFAKVLEYIMYLTPLGVFSLIGATAAGYGPEVLVNCAAYILMAWACGLIVLLLVMILPVWIFAGVSPIAYIKRMAKLWLITLSTCSSAATLPNTIRVCNAEFNVPEKLTSLVVPLGCTIHMCGGAVSFCLLGLFSMKLAGLTVGLGGFLLMLFVALLINMAAPGIPGGGIAIGAAYLEIIGAPLIFLGIYSGIYRLLDMAYTSLNVTGDVSAVILVAKAEEKRLARKRRMS